MNSLRDLLFLNLTLQVFDGLFSYQALSLGAVEANPLVAAAVLNWGVVSGLLYNKTLACALLLLIFVLRRKQPILAIQGLIVTAAMYTCVAVASVWQLLR